MLITYHAWLPAELLEISFLDPYFWGVLWIGIKGMYLYLCLPRDVSSGERSGLCDRWMHQRNSSPKKDFKYGFLTFFAGNIVYHGDHHPWWLLLYKNYANESVTAFDRAGQCSSTHRWERNTMHCINTNVVFDVVAPLRKKKGNAQCKYELVSSLSYESMLTIDFKLHWVTVGPLFMQEYNRSCECNVTLLYSVRARSCAWTVYKLHGLHGSVIFPCMFHDLCQYIIFSKWSIEIHCRAWTKFYWRNALFSTWAGTYGFLF